MTTKYKWHEVYKAALLETDWSRMEDRIQAAESALEERKRELDLSNNGIQDEDRAIADAIRSLRVLRTESISWAAQRSKEAS